MGSEAREEAEKRIRAVQKQIDGLEAEIQRLEKRDDADYARGASAPTSAGTVCPK